MEQLARARIASWQGGSLWLLATAPVSASPAPQTDFHAHHAVQIVMSLGGQFRLWLPDLEASGPYVAVAPDVSHRFDAQGAYAILFVEPESRAGRALIKAMFGEGDLQELAPSRFDALAAQLGRLARTPAPSTPDLAAIGGQMVAALAGSDLQAALDPRIEAVVAWVAQDPDQRVTLDAAARIANLSASRLSHLFVEQTGLSFKTYLLWVRLTRAVVLMAEGDTLTAAAHGAGFSDSAHFSRTFRRMFGIAPANLALV
jgi:AraC family transcriptional regulator